MFNLMNIQLINKKTFIAFYQSKDDDSFEHFTPKEALKAKTKIHNFFVAIEFNPTSISKCNKKN